MFWSPGTAVHSSPSRSVTNEIPETKEHRQKLHGNFGRNLITKNSYRPSVSIWDITKYRNIKMVKTGEQKEKKKRKRREKERKNKTNK